jgi:hypothetical protein
VNSKPPARERQFLSGESFGLLNGSFRAADTLRLCAQSLTHSKSALRAKYRRLSAKLGAPKVIFAMAHHLARLLDLVYRMLRSGQNYVEQGIHQYELKFQLQRAKWLRKEARPPNLQLVPAKQLPPPVPRADAHKTFVPLANKIIRRISEARKLSCTNTWSIEFAAPLAAKLRGNGSSISKEKSAGLKRSRDNVLKFDHRLGGSSLDAAAPRKGVKRSEKPR